MSNPLPHEDLLNRTPPLKMRWAMISFALVATVLNYVHRLSFNYLAANGYLRDIIPDDTFGYIATCFFIAYSALVVLALAGFGYASCSANMLAFPADVVPLSATASVWGVGSVGSGLGGAIFQSLSGLVVMSLSTKYNYAIAYNVVFVGYGLLALTGVAILIFMTGPLVRNKALQEYVDQG